MLPGFAFVLMDDPRDAEDATKELDGTRMCGKRVKVREVVATLAWHSNELE